MPTTPSSHDGSIRELFLQSICGPPSAIHAYSGLQLHCHARQARNSDLKSLKDDIPSYISDVTLDGNHSVSVPTTGTKRTAKDHRGFYATWSARQLVPRAGLEEFDEAPEL